MPTPSQYSVGSSCEYSALFANVLSVKSVTSFVVVVCVDLVPADVDIFVAHVVESDFTCHVSFPLSVAPTAHIGGVSKNFGRTS